MKILKKIVCGLIMAIAMAFHGVSGAEAEPLQMPAAVSASPMAQDILALIASGSNFVAICKHIEEIQENHPPLKDKNLTDFLIEKLAKGSALNFILSEWPNTPALLVAKILAAACLHTPLSIDYLQTYLSELAPYDEGLRARQAAILIAINKNLPLVIDSLLQAGVNPNTSIFPMPGHPNSAFPPLLWAMTFKRYEIVTMLLDAGANPNIRAQHGQHALFMTTNPDILLALLQAVPTEKRETFANTTQSADGTGDTALMIHVSNVISTANRVQNIKIFADSIKCIRYLLSAGADANIIVNGRTALDLTLDKDGKVINQEVYDLLRKWGALQAKYLQ